MPAFAPYLNELPSVRSCYVTTGARSCRLAGPFLLMKEHCPRKGSGSVRVQKNHWGLSPFPLQSSGVGSTRSRVQVCEAEGCWCQLMNGKKCSTSVFDRTLGTVGRSWICLERLNFSSVKLYCMHWLESRRFIRKSMRIPWGEILCRGHQTHIRTLLPPLPQSPHSVKQCPSPFPFFFFFFLFSFL